jgi:hypothetical protein
MHKTIIQTIFEEFKQTRQVTLPGHLLPYEKGYNLVQWLGELFAYYCQEGIIVRPFDDLPPLRLSGEPGIETTVQDVHRFLINDLNLLSPEIRRETVEQSIGHGASAEAWERIAALLAPYLRKLDRETAREELSWAFSPVVEMLHALALIFMEREQAGPPDTVRMAMARFPYYLWLAPDGRPGMWAPESGLCRWEWLAMDLYRRL